MMRKLGKLWLWIVYAFLFLPIFVVIVYSFNAAKYTSNWKASRSSGTASFSATPR